MNDPMLETKTMNKDKSRAFKSVRREIARRLRNKLPLAGIIAATALFCGCNERSGRAIMGDVPREIPPEEEQQTKRQTPKTQPSNCQNETAPAIIMGDVPEPPPSNRKIENYDPAATMGKYPIKNTDK